MEGDSLMLLRSPGLTALVLLAFSGGPGVSAACLDDWGAAANVVRANGLKTVEQLANASPRQLKGQIIKATLCEEDGRYVYRLVVRDPAGQMKNAVLDASGADLAARAR